MLPETTTEELTSGLAFVKLVGAGNDFVLVRREDTAPEVPIRELAIAICARRWGVGADGLIVVDEMYSDRLAITVVNPDGSVATMCGNAVRCAAYYAMSAMNRRSIRVSIGEYCLTARWDGDDIASSFPDPVISSGPRRLQGQTWYDVYSGTEHAVSVVADVHGCEMAAIGPYVRHHRAYQPTGTNVDCVEILGAREILVRTFEKGVEEETPSCASGAVAAAALAAELGLVDRGRIEVRNISGSPLYVTLPRDATGERLRVDGPSTISFTGAWRHLVRPHAC